MSNTPYRGNGLADTPEEEILLVHIALGAVGIAVGSAGVIWWKGSVWLVEHHIFVAGSADPLLEIPGTAGAGLDVARIAILLGIVVALLAIAVSAARRALTRRRENLT